ncbi:MAG: 23S rRNA (uracil(1939)-C(5))-methyltransferase RlmD [Lachnospiraceae bacterium]|nr:23S rRNA (uracil(1939)-C(5))-methyltransferase RlmD [Lachnospiraceae bacterium]
MKLQCPIEKKCGGCQYLAMNYEKQLSIKQDKIIKLIGKYARVNKIVGMEDYLHYRNKINATFKYKKSGIISGVYEEGTHNVLPVDKCFIEDEKADEIIASIRKLIPSFKITVYNEDTGYGLLRHVMIRVGKNSGQIMVVLVTSNPIFPSKKNFANALKKLHPEITTIVQNINDKKTSMVLGPRNQVMLGKGFIEDTLCGMKFKISPNSFYQINVEQTEKLYNLAIEYAGLTGKEKVVDAYCGIGTIGLVASKKAKQVIGVELNKEAVKDAIINAKINDCNNIKFYGNDAGKFMVDMAAKGEKADVVFMDPPRSGSDKPFLDSVIKLAPERIVYISCGPESLARDLDYIVKNSEYKVEKITPVDMFPCTEHVESVVLITRKDN